MNYPGDLGKVRAFPGSDGHVVEGLEDDVFVRDSTEHIATFEPLKSTRLEQSVGFMIADADALALDAPHSPRLIKLIEHGRGQTSVDAHTAPGARNVNVTN